MSWVSFAARGTSVCDAYCKKDEKMRAVCVAGIWQDKLYDFVFLSVLQGYDCRCKMVTTTARGLLQESQPFHTAMDCHNECRKRPDCLQWEWKENDLIDEKWVRKNILLSYTHN